MSFSLLLQPCLACLARLTQMAYEMGSKQLYSHCFVGCCFQNLFKTAFLCIFHLAFYPSISLKSKWCNHTEVLMQLELTKCKLISVKIIDLLLSSFI